MFFDFLDHDDPEVPVEGVAVTAEMLVDLYGVETFGIIPVFVDPPITLLALQLSHVLLAITTFVAPSDIDGIFCATVSLLPDGEPFLARSVMKDVGVNYMGTAFSVASASAGGASSRCWFRSNDFAISQPRLSQQVA